MFGRHDRGRGRGRGKIQFVWLAAEATRSVRRLTTSFPSLFPPPPPLAFPHSSGGMNGKREEEKQMPEVKEEEEEESLSVIGIKKTEQRKNLRRAGA